MVKSSETLRVDEEFKKQVNKIIKDRVLYHDRFDIHVDTPRRITLAMTRHTLFDEICKDIIKAKLGRPNK